MDDQPTEDGYSLRRREEDRRRNWGNCEKCPLTSDGHCTAHEVVNAAMTALKDSVDKGNRLGSWKIGGVITGALAAYATLYGLIWSQGQRVELELAKNRETTIRVVAIQEAMMADLTVIKAVGSPALRERLTKVESELTAHERADLERDKAR